MEGEDISARPEVKQRRKVLLRSLAMNFEKLRGMDTRPRTNWSSLKIDGIRRQLEDLKEKKPEMKKRIEQILATVNKLDLDVAKDNFRRHSCPISTFRPIGAYSWLIYHREKRDDYPCEIEMELKHSAETAIGFFNETSDTKYCVVDMVKAKLTMCKADCVFDLVFTAKLHHDEVADAKTFEARISHGLNPTRILSVTGLPKEESSSSSFRGSRETSNMVTCDATVSNIISLITELQTTEEEDVKLKKMMSDTIKIRDIMSQVNKLANDKLKEEKDLHERRQWLRIIILGLDALRTVNKYPAFCINGCETVIYENNAPTGENENGAEYVRLANKAIKNYNKENKTKYKVEKVIRASRPTIPRMGGGCDVWLKFTAAMLNKDPEIFKSMHHYLGGYPPAKDASVEFVDIAS